MPQTGDSQQDGEARQGGTQPAPITRHEFNRGKEWISRILMAKSNIGRDRARKMNKRFDQQWNEEQEQYANSDHDSCAIFLQKDLAKNTLIAFAEKQMVKR